MPEFTVGDRVRVINVDPAYWRRYLGQTGTVVEVRDFRDQPAVYVVQFIASMERMSFVGDELAAVGDE